MMFTVEDNPSSEKKPSERRSDHEEFLHLFFNDSEQLFSN